MELQGFLVGVPVLAYAVLRNAAGAVRGRLSEFWAWWGRMSVELWVLSWECWLSANGRGVLVLWPRWPVFNLISTSSLLLLAAHEARLLTHSLVARLLPTASPSSSSSSSSSSPTRACLLLPALLALLLFAQAHLLPPNPESNHFAHIGNRAF